MGSGYIQVNLDGTLYGITVWLSDKKYKSNIEPSSYSALSDIEKINFKSFYNNAQNSYWELGVIAQDLQKINKNLVNVMDDGSVDPDSSRLIVWSLRSIQELKSSLDTLSSRISAMERKNLEKDIEISAIKTRLEKLETLLK